MSSLQIAYSHWLNAFEPSRLSLAFQKLLDELEAALSGGSAEAAWRAHTRLLHLAAQLHEPLAAAQVWLALGRAALTLGYHELARKLLESAVERSQGSRHARAVAQWMLGCLLWRLPAFHEGALQTWQEALSSFELLACDPFDQRAAWYKARCAEMRQALAAALDAGVYPGLLATQPRPSQASRPVAPRPGAAWPNRSDPAASAPAPATLGRGGLRPGYIEGFPLQGVVQAGSFSPIAAQPAQPVHFEIQQVVIRQQAYSIRSPYPDAKVLSLDSENYFLLQVSGDSMNRIIQPGDYVLVRRQRSALSGDIVVAEIRGIDGRAALKRYYQPSPSRTQLRPESSNPLHQVYEAQPGDANYTILGKVIAVFQLVG